LSVDADAIEDGLLAAWELQRRADADGATRRAR
jgi:hypothetical protein